MTTLLALTNASAAPSISSKREIESGVRECVCERERDREREKEKESEKKKRVRERGSEKNKMNR